MNELWADRWYYWLHATNIKTAIQDRMSLPYKTDHLWSLAIEEQFYLLWPLLVSRIRTIDGLLRVSCSMIIGSWLLRLIVGVVLHHPIAAYVLMPTRMDGLAFGAAIFALFVMGRLERWRRPALLVGAVSFAIAFTPNMSPWSTTVRVAASISCAAFMTVILTGSQSIVDRPWLRMFGKYSYGIYVIHLPLQLVLKPFEAWARTLPTIGGRWSLPTALAYFAGATALSLGLATISYHLYERPFLALKDRIAPAPPRDHIAPQPLAAGER
jgi:peptidoglycan/LPS O-acetylase OafA/YrhL